MCPPQLSVAFDSGDRAGVRICDSGPIEFPRFDGAVHPSRDDVDPDIYPDDSPLSPAEWLAEHVTDRLGDLDYVDGHTFGGARAAIEPGRLTGSDAGRLGRSPEPAPCSAMSSPLTGCAPRRPAPEP